MGWLDKYQNAGSVKKPAKDEPKYSDPDVLTGTMRIGKNKVINYMNSLVPADVLNQAADMAESKGYGYGADNSGYLDAVRHAAAGSTVASRFPVPGFIKSLYPQLEAPIREYGSRGLGAIHELIYNNPEGKDMDYFNNKVGAQIGSIPGLSDLERNKLIIKQLQAGKLQVDNKQKTKKANGGVITDPRGQWAHPGKVTKIPSNQITMDGVPYPVMGISDTGDTQMMYPGKDYSFDGASVTEYPMLPKAQEGLQADNTRVVNNNTTKGSVIIDPLTKKPAVGDRLRLLIASRKQQNSGNITPYSAWKNMQGKALRYADITTDVMQLGNFIPHPVAQSVGKVGNWLGAGIDAYQTVDNLNNGDYASAAINSLGVALPFALGKNGYLRDMGNTQPGTLDDAIASFGSRNGSYRHLNPLPQHINNPVIQKGVTYNRSVLGALGSETALDTREMGGEKDKAIKCSNCGWSWKQSNAGSDAMTCHKCGGQSTGELMMKAGGEMIKRADGSYSERGLWDNIRANSGSKKKPSSEMLKQERKINSMKDGGWLQQYQDKGEVDPKIIRITEPDGSITTLDINSEEYKKRYKEGNIFNYNKDTDTYIGRKLDEVVVNPNPYSYQGCVNGLCHDYADSNKLPYEDFRKLNNLYGNAWTVGDNSFGENIPYKKSDFSNLKVNDMVNLSRQQFKSDAADGIPNANQHVGRISKIVDGVPYVKHYITSEGRYYEEPINNVKEFSNYSVSGVKRLPQFKDLSYGKPSFAFDKGYQANEIEQSFAEGTKQKREIQDLLRLDNGEFDELAKVAYGIMGNESSFGRSSKTLYRMSVPDFMQKGVKVADDLRRGVDNYDENVNNLSQGYASIKESSTHGVSDNTGKRNFKELNQDIRDGNYKDIERTNNYLYTAMNKMGLTPDNLENGENSFKAIMANLAWAKKRNPNATTEDLLRKFTGKKDVTKYLNSVNNYQKNIDGNPNNNLQYSTKQNVYGSLSNAANVANTGMKDLRSDVVSTVRDMPGVNMLPLNMRQFFTDIAGGKGEITENSLNSAESKAISNVVNNNVANNNYSIGYGDYKTSANKNSDIGGNGGIGFSPEYSLKTTLGQAGIQSVRNNQYKVTDTFDYNDQGKSFGVMDDLDKRGYSIYNLFRSLGRNFGSPDGQGSPSNIVVKKKKTGGQSSWLDKYK